VAGRSGNLRDFAPAAGDAVKKKEERDGAAHEVEKELRDVGPNDGLHPAFERVNDSERNDEEHREAFRCAKRDADDKRDRGHTHAFGDGSRDEKRGCGKRTHARAEPLLDERVCREKFAAEISGQKNQDDEEASKHVAEDELKEGKIAAERDRGSSDDGERGSFRGDNGKRDGPPGSGTASEEIIANVLLAAPKIDAESGDPEQIEDDDGEVERVNVHEVRRG